MYLRGVVGLFLVGVYLLLVSLYMLQKQKATILPKNFYARPVIRPEDRVEVYIRHRSG
jgi:hypothetical protein